MDKNKPVPDLMAALKASLQPSQPSQTDAEREAMIRRDCERFDGIGTSDVKFLLSMIDDLRGALHESRKDRQALIEGKVGPMRGGWSFGGWFVAKRAEIFDNADDALAAYRAGNGETT